MATATISFTNIQELQAYLMNPANYKPARKKSYLIWACMPALGTKVHNSLENADYVVNEKERFVLSGTRGEMWVITAAKLGKTYTLGDGTPINQQTMTAKLNNGVIDWFQVKTIADGSAQLFATFVPAKYQFQVQTSWGATLQGNRPGIPHGKGDFVLCSNNNGMPNLTDVWIVNGAVFADTYDNRGWTDYLDTSHSLDGAPPKPTAQVTTGTSLTKEELGKIYDVFNDFVAEYEHLVEANILALNREAMLRILMTFYKQKAERVKQLLDKVCNAIKAAKSEAEYDYVEWNIGVRLGRVLGCLTVLTAVLKKEKTFKQWYICNRFNAMNDNPANWGTGIISLCVGAMTLDLSGAKKELHKIDMNLRENIDTFEGETHKNYGMFNLVQWKETANKIVGCIEDCLNNLTQNIVSMYWKGVMCNTISFFHWANFALIANEEKGLVKIGSVVEQQSDEDDGQYHYVPEAKRLDGSKWTTTLMFKAGRDKTTGDYICSVKASEGGVKLSKSFKITLDTVMGKCTNYYSFMIYYYVCKELHVSPYAFVTSRSFIASVLNTANGLAEHKGKVESQGVQYGEAKYLFSVKRDTFVRGKSDTEIASCKFVLRYFSVQGKKLLQEVPFKLCIKLPSEAGKKGFNEMRKGLAEASPSHNATMNKEEEAARHVLCIQVLRGDTVTKQVASDIGACANLCKFICGMFYTAALRDEMQGAVEVHNNTEAYNILGKVLEPSATPNMKLFYEYFYKILYHYFELEKYQEGRCKAKVTIAGGKSQGLITYTAPMGTLFIRGEEHRGWTIDAKLNSGESVKPWHVGMRVRTDDDERYCWALFALVQGDKQEYALLTKELPSTTINRECDALMEQHPEAKDFLTLAESCEVAYLADGLYTRGDVTVSLNEIKYTDKNDYFALTRRVEGGKEILSISCSAGSGSAGAKSDILDGADWRTDEMGVRKKIRTLADDFKYWSRH